MATMYFTGDEVAFYGSVDTSGMQVTFSDITAPFLPTDLIIVEIPDEDISHTGEFMLSGVELTSITVVRDGESYEFDVSADAMVLEAGSDWTPSTGDTFFAPQSEVGPPAEGPFAGLDAGQLVFSAGGSFVTGQDTTITRIQSQDLDGNGTISGAAEAGNGLFNVTPVTTVPCYAAGTLIATAKGECRVEDLRPGDLVLTRDRGAQPVRWVRSWTQPLAGEAPDARPVLVPAGALGQGLPVRDLIVSPQHRLLAGGAGQLTESFASEVLVPAKALAGRSGIRHMMGRQSVTWVHFVCDRHEVVRANGCWSESMLLGQEAQLTLTQADLWDLDAVLPPASDPAYLNGAPARPCLPVAAARRQMALIGRLAA